MTHTGRFDRIYANQDMVAIHLTPQVAPPGAEQVVGFGVSLSPAVRGAIDHNLISGIQDRLGFLADQLAAGRIDVEQWYERSAGLVRAAHSAAALAAAGGMRNFTQAHRDELDRRIQEQLVYLQRFADELRSGKQAMNGFVKVRARMYADAAVETYDVVRRGGFQDAGFQ